jgi:hypothetical protein
LLQLVQPLGLTSIAKCAAGPKVIKQAVAESVEVVCAGLKQRKPASLSANRVLLLLVNSNYAGDGFWVLGSGETRCRGVSSLPNTQYPAPNT